MIEGVKDVNMAWKQIIQSLALSAALPGMLFSTALHFTDGSAPLPKPTAVSTEPTQPEVQAEEPEMLTIPVLKSNGEVEQMRLEDYISRVVLGEMPASFEVEALKAQAVAARTYTLRCIESGDKHQGAVCTDYRCCQAYREPEDYLKDGGKQKDIDKIVTAVSDTAGQVLYYEDELICATYFASSGGITEDAQEVWGQAYPYLKSVSSPEEDDTRYDGQKTSFSPKEFQELLGTSLRGKPESWFGMVTYTVGGGVDLMRIGGTLYTGVELRSRLGLRSTIFTVTTTDDKITFETKGYGHRVGLSQYGADAMAVAGSSYDEILAHYYVGTTLAQYPSDND